MKKGELLAIVAAIVYAGDGIEAAIVAATVNAEAEDRPEWSQDPKPLRDGAIPRMEPKEAVALALELCACAAPEAWRVSDE